jgi:hypothetical protein
VSCVSRQLRGFLEGKNKIAFGGLSSDVRTFPFGRMSRIREERLARFPFYT